MLSRLVHGKHWEQAQAVVRQCPKAMRRDLAIQLVQALRDERQYKVVWRWNSCYTHTACGG